MKNRIRMKRILFAMLCTVILGGGTFAQKIVRLYEGKAPGSEDWDYNEISSTLPGMTETRIRNVVDPTLEIYQPEADMASGTAVIIAPGGGNIWLSYNNEGTAVAEWLMNRGITAFVLKYRLYHTPEDPQEFQRFTMQFFSRIMSRSDSSSTQSSGSPLPLPSEKYLGGEDGMRAVEYVREQAEEYGVDPQKIGIMGFSAGAGVTMHTVMNASPEQMPDFAAPIYGGWIGDSEIPEDAPPIFILAAADDPISEGCPDLYKAWRAAGKSAELHMYSKGGHGFGMSQRGLPVDTWIERLYDWMKASGF